MLDFSIFCYCNFTSDVTESGLSPNINYFLTKRQFYETIYVASVQLIVFWDLGSLGDSVWKSSIFLSATIITVSAPSCSAIYTTKYNASFKLQSLRELIKHNWHSFPLTLNNYNNLEIELHYKFRITIRVAEIRIVPYENILRKHILGSLIFKASNWG